MIYFVNQICKLLQELEYLVSQARLYFPLTEAIFIFILSTIIHMTTSSKKRKNILNELSNFLRPLLDHEYVSNVLY